MYRSITFAFIATATTYAFSGQFEISRYSIDSGGDMRSTGGEFELSGTIGQPDAGFSAGSDFSLTGGFWFRLVTGDCNSDGRTNLSDYSSLNTCLSGPTGGSSPNNCGCFNLDNEGADVDILDFAAFQLAFQE